MKQKSYWEMTASELSEATKQFDEEFVVDKSQPLTSAERKEWNRAKQKRERRKASQGSRRISVTIDQGLLKRATELAKKRRISRSELVSQALEEALSQKQ